MDLKSLDSINICLLTWCTYGFPPLHKMCFLSVHKFKYVLKRNNKPSHFHNLKSALSKAFGFLSFSFFFSRILTAKHLYDSFYQTFFFSRSSLFFTMQHHLSSPHHGESCIFKHHSKNISWILHWHTRARNTCWIRDDSEHRPDVAQTSSQIGLLQ